MQSNAQDRSHQHTFFELAGPRLRELCLACGITQVEPVLELFGRLLGAAKDRPLGQHDKWQSELASGRAPFEFAVELASQSPTLELLVEPSGDAGDLASNWARSLSILAELEAEQRLDLTRLRQIQDLFMPSKPSAAFAARLAVSLRADSAPAFRIVLDPRAAGRAMGPLAVEKALVRLGFDAAWPVIGQRMTWRGVDADELRAFTLQLSTAAARVEIWAEHRDATNGDLVHVTSTRPDLRAADTEELLTSVNAAGLARLSCYEFVAGERALPRGVGISLVATDGASLQQRIAPYLARLGQGSDVQQQALAAIVGSASGSVISSLTLWRSDARSWVKVGLQLPELAANGAASSKREEAASGIVAVVDRYEQWDQITNHPFLHRLRREPVNLHHIWKILANFQISISKTFSQRLAFIASRCDDPETRYIVTDLLYDEMGSGDFALAHVNLFSNMMKVMDPWKPEVVDDWVMGPGRNFNLAMDRTYGSDDLYVALGAIVSGEIFGKQFDQFLGDEVRRQNEVDPKLFVWITLHESLEETHADEGADLARLIPKEGMASLTRGAYELSRAAWAFLTDVYEICYGERARA